MKKHSPPSSVADEYNEKVKKKGEDKAVKGVDETEHDKTGCMRRKRKDGSRRP